ncbi:hypothetical protein VNO80_06178 [Phaseolus coccineus]|uniref:Uncharacterized protein n=1 Tax=Phaseolus coccineus TaxID=3886 RepID=A0AAN9NHM0_PHACN
MILPISPLLLPFPPPLCRLGPYELPTSNVIGLTRDGLERVERSEQSSSDLSFAVYIDIAKIQSLCVQMDRFSCSIAAKTERDLWIKNQKRMLEAKERAELLERAVCNRHNSLKDMTPNSTRISDQV